MDEALRSRIFGLSLDERIELVMDLWDSIHADADPFPMDEETAAEIRRRIAESDPADDVAADEFLREHREK